MSAKERPDPASGGMTPAQETMRYLGTTLAVAAVLATVFTAWTPASLSPGELVADLVALVGGGPEETTAAQGGDSGQSEGLRIGIVAGHSGVDPASGISDPGSVCPDGLTELQVNQDIARIVVEQLQGSGFAVDLLEEFDDRLSEYRAVALVSIHADACVYINDQATGFKVSGAVETAIPDRTQRLADCIVDRYARATGLPFHPGSITRDMTEYHTFFEIHNQTPAVIIETGFLYLDRQFLTEEPDLAARGIAQGILCYVNNEPAVLPGEATP